MSTKPQPLTKSSAPPAIARDSMSTTTKKFIGAVEDEWQLYSDCASDYVIGAPIGFGASSIVYAATYYPSSEQPPNTRSASQGIPCALKVLDLDSLPQKSLRLLQRETTLMSLSKHPNVLRVRGSWMDGHKLYIALRLMNKGSAADIMRYGWPAGMEEDVVRCILKQALKGLNYLHINGFIHRDVKAANLLIDDDGTVLLGDLGVAADLTEDTSQTVSITKPYFVTATAALAQSHSRPQAGGKRTVSFDGNAPGATHRPLIGKRKSFVGTPCWMSPELIQGKQYDSSSDIWSFGITALELTQGRPPRSRESPQRVLLKTIQEDPPTLDREGGTYKYSRAFKDIVDCCLVKDPSKRPTAEELLQTPFFKAAKSKSYLINTILKDLPPLTQRQERRVLPAVLSANSIDSWDFGTTINSPTTSIYRRHALEGFVAAEDEEIRINGFFDLGGDISPAHSRSRVVSWAGDPNLKVVTDVEGEGETDIVPSSPSSSKSSHLSSDAAIPPSPPDTSAPSSYTASSDIEHKIQNIHPAHEPAVKEVNLSPIAESVTLYPSSNTPTANKEKLPEYIPTSTSSTPKRLEPSNSQTPTLWRKLKSNVKRPSSSSGLTSDVSPRKEKEKGRINSFFSSSSSKGLLSRASNLSLSSNQS